jgi:hypothetical protein
VDRSDLIEFGLDDDATQIVGDYLTDLDSRLLAGKRARAEIMAETADGLACAVQNRAARGEAQADAARAAVEEFGAPAVVAVAFTRQLGPAAAHRVGAGLVVTGPLVGLTWVAAYTTGGLTWQTQIAGLISAQPQLPLILAVTVPAAIIAVTAGGWAARLFATPPRFAMGAALVAVIGCVAGDLSLLSSVITGPGWGWHGQGLFAVAAIAASVLRLSLAGWAGHRIARLRATES